MVRAEVLIGSDLLRAAMADRPIAGARLPVAHLPIAEQLGAAATAAAPRPLVRRADDRHRVADLDGRADHQARAFPVSKRLSHRSTVARRHHLRATLPSLRRATLSGAGKPSSRVQRHSVISLTASPKNARTCLVLRSSPISGPRAGAGPRLSMRAPS